MPEVSYQAYSNVAWSLAVMGYQDISMFGAVLHQLTEGYSMSWGESGTKGSSAQLKVQAAQQLHQASEWLKPSQGPAQMEPWSRLHSRLQRVAPAPPLKPRSFQGNQSRMMLLQCKACHTKLRFPSAFTRQVLCSLHTTAALLSSSWC